MMGPNYRAFLSKTFGPGGFRLFLSWDDPDPSKRGTSGNRVCYLANGFTKTDHEEGDAWFTGDGISFADGLVQAIMNEAWDKGFRPTGFTDVKNETAAIRGHLQDMRAITAHKLGVPLP